jgi:glycerol kinase
LKFIGSAPEVETLAKTVPDTGGVMVVSAFAGLGAPYWNADARGAILGLTRGSNRGHIARAALEGLAHQVADVVEAMVADSRQPLRGLRVDGGAAANDLLMQTQADLLQTHVRRPTLLETTALGAAFLAGLAVGVWRDPSELNQRWKEQARFEPKQTAPEQAIAREAWAEAVRRLL